MTTVAGGASATTSVAGQAPHASSESSSSGSDTFSMGGVSASNELPRYTSLFNRVAGAVTIRGYLTNFPQLSPAAPNCPAFGPPEFQAELSTAKMVGTADALMASDPKKVISAEETMVIGQQEGEPLAVVVAAAGSGVATVHVAFTNGATDSMAPVHGWVALAASFPALPASQTAPIGTLTAVDRSGRVLFTQKVTQVDGEPSPPDMTSPVTGGGCAEVCQSATDTTVPANAPVTAPGSGVSGSAVSGSAVSGSAVSGAAPGAAPGSGTTATTVVSPEPTTGAVTSCFATPASTMVPLSPQSTAPTSLTTVP